MYYNEKKDWHDPEFKIRKITLYSTILSRIELFKTMGILVPALEPMD